MLNRYYQDELAYLREQGREFAQAHPDAARFLSADGADPDVERLLEGFAFLAGRLHQRLDDGLPELTHALVETFWPHYLCPIPALTTLRFAPARSGDIAACVVPAGTEVESKPVDGTRCRFRTAYPVAVSTVAVDDLSLHMGSPAQLRLRLTVPDKTPWPALKLPSLRLHLAGAPAVAQALHLCLVRHCTRVTAIVGERRLILAGRPQPVGFAPDQRLLAPPGASFPGFVLLQEYFAWPGRFLYADIGGLDALAGLGPISGPLTLEFSLQEVPAGMLQVTAANVLTGCTPAVNCFTTSADPIAVDSTRHEYLLRAGEGGRVANEIHAVRAVSGLARGQTQARTYVPLYHAEHFGDVASGTWLVRRRPAVAGPGGDCWLVLPAGGSGASDEVLSIEVTCTNRHLPLALGPGDIATVPIEFASRVQVRNLAKPTTPVHPPLGQDLEWRLLAHLALGRQPIADVDGLRRLIDLYDLRATVDHHAQLAHRRLRDAVLAVATRSATRFDEGLPVRGIAIEITLSEDGFDGEGGMHLLALVLDEFFSQYAAINAFSRLSVRGAQRGVLWDFPPRLGRRTLA